VDEFIRQMIADGYLDSDLAPLKCHNCDSMNLDQKYFYESTYVVEVDVTCKDCGNSVGHWAYGGWQV
jgi:hypothetical protein